MVARHFISTLSILILSCYLGFSQKSFGGKPASYALLKRAILEVPVYDLPAVDNQQLLREEEQNSLHLKHLVFAKSFQVDLDPARFGAWEKTDEFNVWRLSIRSRGAWSLNLLFDKLILPPGGRLFLYNADKSVLLGAFTSQNELSGGNFGTLPIPGDQIVVEYNEPIDGVYQPEIHISTVNHDFKNVFGTRPLGEAGACNVDLNCPQGEPFKIEKQAVVDIVIAGRELCTGTLINNVRQDKTPYVLTAGHCIEKASDAVQSIFCFNYESPVCGSGGSSINGFGDQTLSGSILKSRSDSLDFALVQLESIPPIEYRPYYMGWNRSKNIPSSTAVIHHPKGDVKKISIDNDPPVIGSYGPTFKSNSFWTIGKWEVGVTEAGSSGSGLMNQNKELIGSLTGGTASCLNPADDLFSVFFNQWDYYKNLTAQLKVWLDPDNTGAISVPGLSPYSPTTSCTLFSNAIVGEKYSLQPIGVPKNGYLGGHNRLSVDGYAERFNQTDLTQVDGIAIGVAKVVLGGSDTSGKIVLKIWSKDTFTGLPSQERLSMDIPYTALSNQKMNYISLDQSMQLSGPFFVGYELSYANPKDTFAVYSAIDRLNLGKNQAFARVSGSWKPFYWIPDLGVSSSLLINVLGCSNSLSNSSPVTSDPDNKFTVLYPNTGVSDYVWILNKGVEEYTVLSVYDMMGRKLATEERMLSGSPTEFSFQKYLSGVYFLTLETKKNRQVIKIKVNKSV